MNDTEYIRKLEDVAVMAISFVKLSTLDQSIKDLPHFKNLENAINRLKPKEEYKIVICGSRIWESRETIYNVLSNIPQKLTHKVTIIHGDCYGADKMAGEIARELGYQVIEVPAEWHRYGKAAGPRRNDRMLKFKPNEVIAFHNDLSQSKGTANTVSQARSKGYKVTLYDYSGNSTIWANT